MRISKEKKEKISEQILAFLYSVSPKSVFTSYIAQEIARDEEFTKELLIKLRDDKFVNEIKKNPFGKSYLKRRRWKLSDVIYGVYVDKQNSN